MATAPWGEHLELVFLLHDAVSSCEECSSIGCISRGTWGPGKMSCDSYRGTDGLRMILMSTHILDDDLVLTWGCVRCGLDLERVEFWCGQPCCCVGRHSGLERGGGKDGIGADGRKTLERWYLGRKMLERCWKDEMMGNSEEMR